MKKIFLILTFLFLGPTVVKAIPFVMNNNSFNSTKLGNYSTRAHLLYAEENALFNSPPGVCANPNWMLTFYLNPGDSYSIPDGNYIYTSPYNGNMNCIGETISANCDIELGWYGVRAGDYYNINWDPNFGVPYHYYGLAVISYAFPCYGGNPNPVTGSGISFTSAAAAYVLETNAMKLTFNTYGVTLSTILYE